MCNISFSQLNIEFRAQFTGSWPWNGHTSSPHSNHPEITSISHVSLFFKCEAEPASSKFWFLNTHTLYDKQAKTIMKCEIEMRPAPPHFQWNLDTGSKLKVVLALQVLELCCHYFVLQALFCFGFFYQSWCTALLRWYRNCICKPRESVISTNRIVVVATYIKRGKLQKFLNPLVDIR